MSIQRYNQINGGDLEEADDGYLVFYDAHAAAVAEAEQERDRIWQMRIEAGGYVLTLNQPTLEGLFNAHYEQGQRDALRDLLNED